MNNDYLLRAREVIPDAKTLIILASKRAKALAYGARPMVRCSDDNHLDIALLEIAEGKLIASTGENASAENADNNLLQEFADARTAAAAANGENKIKEV